MDAVEEAEESRDAPRRAGLLDVVEEVERREAEVTVRGAGRAVAAAVEGGGAGLDGGLASALSQLSKKSSSAASVGLEEELKASVAPSTNMPLG